MKILLLSDGIPPFVMGGMQKHTLNLCKFLVLAGHDVTLAHCVGHLDEKPNTEEVRNAIFDSAEERSNFRDVIFNFPAPGKIPGHYIRASKLYSELIFQKFHKKLDEFDFIYCKGFSGWKTLLEKGKGVFSTPIGIKFHGYEMFQTQPSFKSKLQSKLLIKPVLENHKLADYIFSYGGKVSTIIYKLGIPKEKIVEIPGAVDSFWVEEKYELNTANDKVKFLFVGRFERRKGIEELSKAIESLIKIGNEHALFEFVGPIPKENQINHSQVLYHGSISDKNEIKKIYRQNHVLICPSYSEGMPNVIMEAMSQGLAVIATDVGATQMLVNQNTGWLLENSLPEAILEKINTAFNEKSGILEKREAARTHILNSFTWNQVIKQTELFFERAVEK
jgi:glycosyltransferase involved in cell wall biosynthesis